MPSRRSDRGEKLKQQRGESDADFRNRHVTTAVALSPLLGLPGLGLALGASALQAEPETQKRVEAKPRAEAVNRGVAEDLEKGLHLSGFHDQDTGEELFVIDPSFSGFEVSGGVEGFIEVGHGDIGTNAAGGRITRRLYKRDPKTETINQLTDSILRSAAGQPFPFSITAEQKKKDMAKEIIRLMILNAPMDGSGQSSDSDNEKAKKKTSPSTDK